jgi:Txe/YoeB family toxin of Txe-Axe toxin-antitoxin module
MARGTQQSAQEDGPHKASYEKTALSDLNEFVELDSKGKNRIREFAQKAKENPNLGRAYEEIDGRVSELVSLTIPEKYRSHSSLRADQEINIIKLLHFYETGDYGFFDESIDLEGQDRTGREEK